MFQTPKNIMIPIRQSNNLRHLQKRTAWKQVALLVRVQANPWAPEAPSDLATSPPKPGEDVKTVGPLTGWGKPWFNHDFWWFLMVLPRFNNQWHQWEGHWNMLHLWTHLARSELRAPQSQRTQPVMLTESGNDSWNKGCTKKLPLVLLYFSGFIGLCLL